MKNHDRNEVVDTLVDARNFITDGKANDLNVREQRLVERINAAIDLLTGPEIADKTSDFSNKRECFNGTGATFTAVWDAETAIGGTNDIPITKR